MNRLFKDVFSRFKSNPPPDAVVRTLGFEMTNCKHPSSSNFSFTLSHWLRFCGSLPVIGQDNVNRRHWKERAVPIGWFFQGLHSYLPDFFLKVFSFLAGLALVPSPNAIPTGRCLLLEQFNWCFCDCIAWVRMQCKGLHTQNALPHIFLTFTSI